ncbi:hypothetical protein pipiens_009985 [Culex pipiens pipiens]|uniref:FAD synthase n=2 Tax=Culex pipiens TaxID=7175 RepID=A0A8D8NW64_CULPI
MVDDTSYHEKIEQSKQLVEHAFKSFKQNEIFLSFNGGKDCTVLLDIIIKLLQEHASEGYELNCIYMQPAEPFEEIEEFMKACQNHYQVRIRTMRGGIKAILEQICDENSNIKACIMGSRRTDPYCDKLQPMQETDAGWPKLMRINPLLSWTCNDVWKYIRSNNVPYCALYDQGYTSIGDKTNTIPNPYLKRTGNNGEEMYLAAFQLEEGDQYERAGRL